MARPSVSSQSLVDLASSKVQAKKERQGYEENKSVAPSFLDQEITQELINNKGLKYKQEQHKNIELIRKKYTLQNKSLAKNNSLMMLRISEMEAKVSDLINENMLLRKRRTFKDAEMKKQLESKFKIVEVGLMHKFNEIFEMLKSIRLDEGMSENPHLDVFKNLLNEAPSATSTPIEEPTEIGNSPFVFNSRLLMQSLKDDSFFLPKSHLYLHTVDKDTNITAVTKNKDTIEKKEEDTAVQPEDRMDLVKENTSNELDFQDLEKVSSIQENRNHGLKETEDQDIDSVESTQKHSIHNENAISSEPRVFNVYKDEDKGNEEVDVANNAKNSKRTKVSGKSEQNQPEVIQEDPQIKQEESQEGTRRPSRSRKPVSYKWPSLSKKMRRKSEKFVDAVIIPDEEGQAVDSNIKDEPQPQNDRKRSKSSDNIEQNSSKRSKRQPLGNVTQTNNNKINSMKEIDMSSKKKALISVDYNDKKVVRSKMNEEIEGDEENDPSIFDFDNVHKPPKTYKKRKQGIEKGEKRTYENRRHSMLI